MKSVYQWKIYSRILSSSPVTSKWCEVSIPIYGRERGFGGLQRVKPRFNSSHKGSESAQEVRSLTYNRFNNNNPTQTHHPSRSKINPISNLENPGLVGQLATSSTYQLVRHIYGEFCILLYSFGGSQQIYIDKRYFLNSQVLFQPAQTDLHSSDVDTLLCWPVNVNLNYYATSCTFQ